MRTGTEFIYGNKNIVSVETEVAESCIGCYFVKKCEINWTTATGKHPICMFPCDIIYKEV